MNFSQMAGRTFALAAMLCLAVLLLWPASSAFAAAPPAGTSISNQASATYTDGNAVSRSTTSNAVITTVAQVRSYTLSTTGQSRNATPGQTVYFAHSIVNTGNGQDTYVLGSSTAGAIFSGGVQYFSDANGDGVPDNATPITSVTIPAFAAQPTRFVAAVVIGAAAAQGATGTLTVTANDNNNLAGTVQQTNTDTVTVSNAAIAVIKSLSMYSGPAGQAGVLVTLGYSNSGTAAATNLVLTDVLPAGMTYTSNQAQWSVSGATLLLDSGVGTPAGLTYTYNSGTKTVSATIATVGAGSSGQITFPVSIAGGLSPTNAALGSSCVTAGCQALTTNTATFQYTVGAATTTSTPTNPVTYSVAQTASVAFNGSSVSSAIGTGLPLTVASASQGATVTYTSYVWNTGNGVDTFNITNLATTFPAGTTFQYFKPDGTTPLQDTNSDGTPDTGPLAVGGNTAVVIKALLPSTATGNNAGAGWAATFDAKSTFNSAVKDTLNNIRLTTIVGNSVDLTANAAVGGGGVLGTGTGAGVSVLTQNVTPASAASTASAFRLYVNNTAAAGGAADTYNLTATGLPTGWSAAFYNDGGAGTCATLGTALTNTGSIAQGANRLVCYVVSVPSITSGNAAPQTPLFTVTATSASTANTDNISVTVAVQTVNNVTLTPNGNQQTFAGSAVTYTHTLQNLGNVAQTVSFAGGFLSDTQAGAGWTSVAYQDTNSNGVLDVGTDAVLTTSSTVPLPVGGTKTVFVRVFAPGSATSASPADVTLLTATYSSTTTSATDTTTVTDGLLLNKQHVAVASCAGGTPVGGWTTNPYNGSVAGFNAIPPGQCVAYQITGTNTTSNPITGITVNDGTPANTTLNTACGAVTATAGYAVVGSPANGGTGTFTVTSGATLLNPGQSFVITFCVRINQ